MGDKAEELSGMRYSDQEQAACDWERSLTQFISKVRFFRVADVNDGIDNLLIFGGETIEELSETLPTPQDSEYNNDSPGAS